MLPQYKHPVSGAEFRQQDVNGISENAALADDRVLAELLRLAQGSTTPDRGILPIVRRDQRPLPKLSSTALIQGGTPDATVRLGPFRAIVGSREMAPGYEHLYGQRSGLLVGDNALATVVPVAPNPSPSPRWTLVYATVVPDAEGEKVELIRYTKAGQEPIQVAISRQTTVAVSTVDGTPAQEPKRPNIPSDGAGNYHIPLAYLWIAGGFDTTGIVLPKHIHEVAPILTLGKGGTRPADQGYLPGGTVDMREGGEKSPKRPAAYLPPSMVGDETLLIALRLAEAYPPVSHKSGDVIDASRDWRHRLFFWDVYCGHAGNTFAWDQGQPGHVPSALLDMAGTADLEYFRNAGMGQSFWDDSPKLPFGTKPPGAHGLVLWLDSDYKPRLKALNPNTSTGIVLYVRASDGALAYHVVRGEPKGTLLIRLTASGQHPNH